MFTSMPKKHQDEWVAWAILKIKQGKRTYVDLDYEETTEVLTFIINSGLVHEIVTSHPENIVWASLFGSTEQAYDFILSVRQVVTEHVKQFVDDAVSEADKKLKRMH